MTRFSILYCKHSEQGVLSRQWMVEKSKADLQCMSSSVPLKLHELLLHICGHAGAKFMHQHVVRPQSVRECSRASVKWLSLHYE